MSVLRQTGLRATDLDTYEYIIYVPFLKLKMNILSILVIYVFRDFIRGSFFVVENKACVVGYGVLSIYMYAVKCRWYTMCNNYFVNGCELLNLTARYLLIYFVWVCVCVLGVFKKKTFTYFFMFPWISHFIIEYGLNITRSSFMLLVKVFRNVSFYLSLPPSFSINREC